MTKLLLSALMLERLAAQDTFLPVVFIMEEVNTIRIVPFVIHVICKVLGQRDFYFILGPAACRDIPPVAQNSISCTGKTILSPFIFVLLVSPFIFVLLNNSFISVLLFQLLHMRLLAVKVLVVLTLAKPMPEMVPFKQGVIMAVNSLLENITLYEPDLLLSWTLTTLNMLQLHLVAMQVKNLTNLSGVAVGGDNHHACGPSHR